MLVTVWKLEGTSGGHGARLTCVSNKSVSQSKFTCVTKFSESRIVFAHIAFTLGCVSVTLTIGDSERRLDRSLMKHRIQRREWPSAARLPHCLPRQRDHHSNAKLNQRH